METNPPWLQFDFSIVFACLVLRMCFPVVYREVYCEHKIINVLWHYFVFGERSGIDLLI